MRTHYWRFTVHLYMYALMLDLDLHACIPTSSIYITPMPCHALAMSAYLHTLVTKIQLSMNYQIYPMDTCKHARQVQDVTILTLQYC